MKNRPERIISFLVVWLTMFSCIWVSGQNPYPLLKKKDFLQIHYQGTHQGQFSWNSPFVFKNEGEKSPFLAYYHFHSNYGELSVQEDGLYAQPANLYYLQSGFFCKREWELEKFTHIPFRFRLGSLADCNTFEGKH